MFIENSGFGGSSAAPAAGLLIKKYLRGHVVAYYKRMEDWIKYGSLMAHLCWKGFRLEFGEYLCRIYSQYDGA